MGRNRAVRIVKFAIFAALFVFIVGFVVMRLWNWLTPPLFGLPVITFWQAVGLLVLCKLLFGGFRGGPHRRWGGGRRMMERWAKMSPEEREKFRQQMRGMCGPFESSAGEAKSTS